MWFWGVLLAYKGRRHWPCNWNVRNSSPARYFCFMSALLSLPSFPVTSLLLWSNKGNNAPIPSKKCFVWFWIKFSYCTFWKSWFHCGFIQWNTHSVPCRYSLIHMWQTEIEWIWHFTSLCLQQSSYCGRIACFKRIPTFFTPFAQWHEYRQTKRSKKFPQQTTVKLF